MGTDALMVRGYKHMKGMSRHAHTDALLGPWEHGYQGLTRSSQSWQAAVAREWVGQGAWAKEDFRESQTYTLQTHQALRGGIALPCSPRDNAPTPRCPHLIGTLQRVVDEVFVPIWMRGPCSGTTPILMRGPGGPRAGAVAAPAPGVEVQPTQYGDAMQVVVPPTVYATVRALGYYHWGNLYEADRRIKGEQTVKKRAPACKGIPGFTLWLARHIAVRAPLLQVPPLRW